MIKPQLNQRVKVDVPNKALNGRTGVITGLYPKNALPIAVTLDGDNYETDFTYKELTLEVV